MIYNALLSNCIEKKIEKVLRENQNGFRSTTSQILNIRRILKVYVQKNL